MQANVKLHGTERHINSSDGERKVEKQEQGLRTSTTAGPDPTKSYILHCACTVFTPVLFI